ncbi:MAG: nucleoside deaminase [bacterium]|nr:nucleoside deaminase [bacterium]
MTDLAFIREAIRLAADPPDAGGPFGAIIVKDGRVVGRGRNRVTADNDPTAHAEIVAIRDACRNMGTFALADCAIYASCEPCPMCLAAIYWARIARVFYAADRRDAAAAGFDDARLWGEMVLEPTRRTMPAEQLARDEGAAALAAWAASPGRQPY